MIERGTNVGDPVKDAWGEVAEGFSELGRAMKGRYVGEAQPDQTAAPPDGLREALERLVAAGRDIGQRAADVVRDADVNAQVKQATVSLNDALSATVDMIGREVAGWFGRPEVGPEDASVVDATATDGPPRVVEAYRVIAADPAAIFELIADPARQPSWDGNDNLAEAAPGQRVHAVGDVFTTTLTMGSTRENHVVEFEEGRRIAWRPAEPGEEPPGHLWRWTLEPLSDGRTLVTHVYDWTQLTDPDRLRRAQATTADMLGASLAGLADLVERPT